MCIKISERQFGVKKVDVLFILHAFMLQKTKQDVSNLEKKLNTQADSVTQLSEKVERLTVTTANIKSKWKIIPANFLQETSFLMKELPSDVKGTTFEF